MPPAGVKLSAPVEPPLHETFVCDWVAVIADVATTVTLNGVGGPVQVVLLTVTVPVYTAPGAAAGTVSTILDGAAAKGAAETLEKPAVIAALLHVILYDVGAFAKAEYGRLALVVPPDTDGFVPKVIPIAAGCVTFLVLTTLPLAASVIVHVYEPATNPVALAAEPPEGAQE